MTLTPAAPHHHSILTTCDQISGLLDDLDELAETSPVYLDTREKAQALRQLGALEARVAAARLRVLAVAGDVAEEAAGHRDLGSWLHTQTLTDKPAAVGQVRLAQRLTGYDVLATALAEGRLTLAQAQVIGQALHGLPADTGPELRGKAEAHLVDLAAIHTPTELRRLGRGLLETLDPDRYEAAEARALEGEEQAAQRRVSCRFRDHGDGTVSVDLKLPLSDAARLKTYLEAYAQPRKQQLNDRGKRILYDQLLGQGFQHLLAHLDPADLPHHGGDATTVVVTIGLDDLIQELGTAQLGWEPANGEKITATEARRLACHAGIIPAVLGSHGEVLDLGRTSRLHTPAQRKAIRLRDQHCRTEHCDVPAPWCDVHHLTPWSQGGKTDLTTGILLCGHHHRQVHQPGVETQRLPNGDLRYHRRT